MYVFRSRLFKNENLSRLFRLHIKWWYFYVGSPKFPMIRGRFQNRERTIPQGRGPTSEAVIYFFLRFFFPHSFRLFVAIFSCLWKRVCFLPGVQTHRNTPNCLVLHKYTGTSIAFAIDTSVYSYLFSKFWFRWLLLWHRTAASLISDFLVPSDFQLQEYAHKETVCMCVRARVCVCVCVCVRVRVCVDHYFRFLVTLVEIRI